ncbi:MAG: amino acid ABC transporter permease [Oscillospiraceae bacterium]|nr:amino acid ABC transporter permease [Oscillospiraceae bacterium]
MLQLIIIFYGPGLLNLDIKLPRLTAVLIAFIINYSCYFSEIFRGGIESIPKGQYEAGQVLGMTKTQIFFKVVLFQVIKRIVPPMGNEIITLVKDTSLARVIAVTELVKAAERIVTLKGLIWPLFYIGAFYLAFSALLTLLLNYAEKKMSYYSV